MACPEALRQAGTARTPSLTVGGAPHHAQVTLLRRRPTGEGAPATPPGADAPREAARAEPPGPMAWAPATPPHGAAQPDVRRAATAAPKGGAGAWAAEPEPGRRRADGSAPARAAPGRGQSAAAPAAWGSAAAAAAPDQAAAAARAWGGRAAADGARGAAGMPGRPWGRDERAAAHAGSQAEEEWRAGSSGAPAHPGHAAHSGQSARQVPCSEWDTEQPGSGSRAAAAGAPSGTGRQYGRAGNERAGRAGDGRRDAAWPPGAADGAPPAPGPGPNAHALHRASHVEPAGAPDERADSAWYPDAPEAGAPGSAQMDNGRGSAARPRAAQPAGSTQRGGEPPGGQSQALPALPHPEAHAAIQPCLAPQGGPAEAGGGPWEDERWYAAGAPPAPAQQWRPQHEAPQAGRLPIVQVRDALSGSSVGSTLLLLLSLPRCAMSCLQPCTGLVNGGVPGPSAWLPAIP